MVNCGVNTTVGDLADDLEDGISGSSLLDGVDNNLVEDEGDETTGMTVGLMGVGMRLV